MSHRPFKQRIYYQFARVGSALASDKRLELLDLLAQGPRNVEALAAETDMSVANASQHLQVLRQTRLVEAEREGTKINYRLASDGVLRLWLELRSVAESRLAELKQIVDEFSVDGVSERTLPRDELERMTEEGEVFLIDVRPKLEYENGHIPAAVSVPILELVDRLEELPRGRRIVAYCRGTYCLFADEAVAILRQHGFDAYRLDGGWPEWKADGKLVS